MSIEGGLNITLKRDAETGNQVLLESSRAVHASRILQGKTPSEALQLIPLLFSICGTAQSCAGVRASEQTLGLRASPETERLRDLLVNMETLREHLWRILLDWPSFIGAEADKLSVAEVMVLQRAYRQALCSDLDPFSLGGIDCHPDTNVLKSVVERIAAFLQHNVFNMTAAEWLKLPGETALVHWAESSETIAAQLITHILHMDWSGVGACDSAVLPILDEAQLHQSMQSKDFVEQPQWLGQCCETSSLTRINSPLLDSLKQTYGKGLLVRLVARLTEIAYLAERLLPDRAEDGDDHKSSEQGVCNPGIGQSHAARGELVHRIILDGDVIHSYQILAPTEWNFHPQGVVSKALSELKGDREQLEKQARLLINAIDPCVGYELHIDQEFSSDA